MRNRVVKTYSNLAIQTGSVTHNFLSLFFYPVGKRSDMTANELNIKVGHASASVKGKNISVKDRIGVNRTQQHKEEDIPYEAASS